MHRHGYKGRKFGRERDQRRALKRGLALSLFEHGAITTTLPKAKELRPFAEKLISKAKKGDLANRRRVMAALGNNVAASNHLIDEVAPKIARNSGYLRIVKLDDARVGDNAPMARIEFVDEIKTDPVIASETKQSIETPSTDNKKGDK
ncbi:MAG: 50S ribosomal protein L17 [Candidatus Nomurabacteria bacterium]|jgi:large subunit ribosomal protein L17|nr:50S ribosomal protein L17 [Candidatus Nomurabacteria bacterium]